MGYGRQLRGTGSEPLVECRAQRSETTPGAKTGLLVPALHELFVGMPSVALPSQVRVFTTP